MHTDTNIADHSSTAVLCACLASALWVAAETQTNTDSQSLSRPCIGKAWKFSKTFGNHCYEASKARVKLSFATALAHCASIGGYLLEIDSEEERKFVHDEFFNGSAAGNRQQHVHCRSQGSQTAAINTTWLGLVAIQAAHGKAVPKAFESLQRRDKKPAFDGNDFYSTEPSNISVKESNGTCVQVRSGFSYGTSQPWLDRVDCSQKCQASAENLEEDPSPSQRLSCCAGAICKKAQICKYVKEENPRLTVVKFGKLSWDNDIAKGHFSTGTKLQFECLPGFMLNGSRQQVCKNGKWSGKSPSCERTSATPSAETNTSPPKKQEKETTKTCLDTELMGIICALLTLLVFSSLLLLTTMRKVNSSKSMHNSGIWKPCCPGLQHLTGFPGMTTNMPGSSMLVPPKTCREAEDDAASRTSASINSHITNGAFREAHKWQPSSSPDAYRSSRNIDGPQCIYESVQ